MDIIKNNDKPSITYIVEHLLCTGCGTCQDSCPNDSIIFKVKKGLNTPLVNQITCRNKKGCSICYDICPGKGIDLMHQGENLFNEKEIKVDYYIGRYLNCYSGYSSNDDIRYHSAAGGMVSQFLIYLIEHKVIDGAVVTGFESENPMKPYSYIATTKEDILKGRSSKYCPVALNGMATEIKNQLGKYIVVGLPCHIQGLRNLEKIDKKLKEHIFGYFSIYCSSNRNFYAQDFIINNYGIDKKNLKSFAYRDDGCLGFLKAEHNNGQIVKIGFGKYYPLLRSFFKPKRCLTCIDHYGDLADVCFGDIQVGKYKNDKIGINSLIVRNAMFDLLLNQAKKDGIIVLDKISKEIVNESQVMLYHKRFFSKSIMLFDKLFFRKFPVYDMKLKGKLNLFTFIRVFLTYFQLFIGKHKRLWFIINILKKN